jgi:transcriptional regulator with XRE-family HTH domain
MSERSTLGVVIRRRRQELGWTQEELAERISTNDEYVRQSEISRIENGKIDLPRRERLIRLAEVLSLSLGELLARSGWAGADLHFRQNDRVEAVPEDAPVSTVSSLLQTLLEHASVRRSSQSNSPESMSALRRALSTMHDESDRLSRNRVRSVDILEQMHRRPRDRRPDDYAEPSAT